MKKDDAKIEFAKYITDLGNVALTRIDYGDIYHDEECVFIPLKLVNEPDENKIGQVKIKDSKEGGNKYAVTVSDKVLFREEDNNEINIKDKTKDNACDYDFSISMNSLFCRGDVESAIYKISKKYESYVNTISQDNKIHINGRDFEWTLMNMVRLPYFYVTIINNRAYALEEARLKLLTINIPGRNLYIEKIPLSYGSMNFIRNGNISPPFHTSPYKELLYPVIDKEKIQIAIEKNLTMPL